MSTIASQSQASLANTSQSGLEQHDMEATGNDQARIEFLIEDLTNRLIQNASMHEAVSCGCRCIAEEP